MVGRSMGTMDSLGRWGVRLQGASWRISLREAGSMGMGARMGVGMEGVIMGGVVGEGNGS